MKGLLCFFLITLFAILVEQGYAAAVENPHNPDAKLCEKLSVATGKTCPIKECCKEEKEQQKPERLIRVGSQLWPTGNTNTTCTTKACSKDLKAKIKAELRAGTQLYNPWKSSNSTATNTTCTTDECKDKTKAETRVGSQLWPTGK